MLLSPSRGACFKKAPPDAYLRNALKPITMEREATLGKTGTTKGRKEAELDTRGYVRLSRSIVKLSPQMPKTGKLISFCDPALLLGIVCSLRSEIKLLTFLAVEPSVRHCPASIRLSDRRRQGREGEGRKTKS